MFPYVYATPSTTASALGAVVAVAAVFGAVAWNRKLSRPQDTSPGPALYSPAQCCEIISCKSAGDPSIVNTLQHLRSRAIPNQRLRDVFGIENSFTTTDIGRNKSFKTLAAMKMRHADWDLLRDRARDILHARLAAATTRGESPLLKQTIQSLTLRLALQVFFEADAAAIDELPVQVVAAEVDRLWTTSKDAKTNERWPDQHLLRIALQGMLPEASLDDEENPLNLIIPAYETMWRVVLLGYVEILHKELTIPMGYDKRRAWLNSLRDFLKHPTPFEHVDSGDSRKSNDTKAIQLAAETLRVYPSTRSIYRQLHLNTDVDPVLISIDVQKVQRSYTRGNDLFDPKDFAKQPNVGFLAFGVPPFKCPASYGFGERMITLLIAALIEATEGSWLLDTGADAKALSGSALPSGRNDSGHWRLRISR